MIHSAANHIAVNTARSARPLECAFDDGEATFATSGGFALAKEYDIERKWREARLSQAAPISTNLILAYIGRHVLGMPRSY